MPFSKLSPALGGSGSGAACVYVHGGHNSGIIAEKKIDVSFEKRDNTDDLLVGNDLKEPRLFVPPQPPFRAFGAR